MTTVTIYLSSIEDLKVVHQIEQSGSIEAVQRLKMFLQFNDSYSLERTTTHNLQVNVTLELFSLIGIFAA